MKALPVMNLTNGRGKKGKRLRRPKALGKRVAGEKNVKPAPPSFVAAAFNTKLLSLHLESRIWNKRSIEWYYPEPVHVGAQGGDASKENATRTILKGDQAESYKKAAGVQNVCVPRGKKLRELLEKHLTKRSQLDQEIIDVVDKLLAWKKEIFGE